MAILGFKMKKPKPTFLDLLLENGFQSQQEFEIVIRRSIIPRMQGGDRERLWRLWKAVSKHESLVEEWGEIHQRVKKDFIKFPMSYE